MKHYEMEVYPVFGTNRYFVRDKECKIWESQDNSDDMFFPKPELDTWEWGVRIKLDHFYKKSHDMLLIYKHLNKTKEF